MLANDQLSLHLGQFHKKCSIALSMIYVLKLSIFKITGASSRSQRVKCWYEQIHAHILTIGQKCCVFWTELLVWLIHLLPFSEKPGAFVWQERGIIIFNYEIPYMLSSYISTVLCTSNAVTTWSTLFCRHYNDVIMKTMEYQITSLTIVYKTVYSSAYQRKHQSSASLAFVRGCHRWPVNSPHIGASNAENVAIWCRHHGWCIYIVS